MTGVHEFDPDWTVHPGWTLQTARKERGMSQDDLAATLGLDRRRVNEICNGRRAITPRIALSLEAAGLGTARFWVTAQALYDLDVERGKKVMRGG